MGFQDNVNVDVRGAAHIAPCTYKTVVLKQNITKQNLNVLTQAMLDKYGANTKFVIKWDYVLQSDITIPENCVLEFDGGSLSNGTLVCNDTFIESSYCVFMCDVQGTVKNGTILSEWFCYDTKDFSSAFIKIVNLSNSASKPIRIKHDVYTVDDTIHDITLRNSIDFCDSELICNVTNQHFKINVTNSERLPITDNDDINAIKQVINNRENNYNGYKDCLIEVHSSDVEFQRNHVTQKEKPFYKREFFYVDKDGTIINPDFYNYSIDNITSVTSISCRDSIYFKNLVLTINDNFTGTQTDMYRSLGIEFKYCSNILFDNIVYHRRSALNTVYTFKCNVFERCYNVRIENFRAMNTDPYNGSGERSSYVLFCNSVVGLYLTNAFISGASIDNRWGHMGCHYLSNVIVDNCVLSRFDTHHRLNNAIIKNTTFYGSCIAVTGYGYLNVHDCIFYGTAAITLREDYGSYWDGDININRCEIIYDQYMSLIKAAATNFDYKNDRVKSYGGRTINASNIIFKATSTTALAVAIVFLTAAGTEAFENPVSIADRTYPNIYVENIIFHQLEIPNNNDKSPIIHLDYKDAIIVDSKTLNLSITNFLKDKAENVDLANSGVLVNFIGTETVPYNNLINIKIKNANFPIRLALDHVNYTVENCTIFRFSEGSYNADIYNSTIGLKFVPADDISGTIRIYGCLLNGLYNKYEIDVPSGKLFYNHYNNFILKNCILSSTLANTLRGSHSEDLHYSSNDVIPMDTINNPSIGKIIFYNGVPAWWNRTAWVDATGVVAGTSTSGTFANKPTVSANSIPIGFKYFCTDKQTTEGATDGIEIIHKGNDVWVDALGRTVS